MVKIKKFRNSTEDVLVFSRWRKKGYAVFQTLKRIIVIAVLIISYLISVPSESCAIENDTIEVKGRVVYSIKVDTGKFKIGISFQDASDKIFKFTKNLIDDFRLKY